MNTWFESNNLASYAKTAFIEAQKRIDKVLDINEAGALGATGATGGAGGELMTNGTASSSSIGGGVGDSSIGGASTAASFAGVASNAFEHLMHNATSALGGTKANSANNHEPFKFELDFLQTKPLQNNLYSDSNSSPSVAKTPKQQQPQAFLSSPSASSLTSSSNNTAVASASFSTGDTVDKQHWVQSYLDSNGHDQQQSDTNPAPPPPAPAATEADQQTAASSQFVDDDDGSGQYVSVQDARLLFLFLFEAFEHRVFVFVRQK